MLAKFIEIKKSINAAQQMIEGDMVIELEGVEQTFLTTFL